jgi:hypothetical protein
MQSSFPFPGRFDGDLAADSKWQEYANFKLRDPAYINDSDSKRLKADGNLSYADFIHVVKLLWENSYPDIPIVPTYGGAMASYPCIAYGMELKRAHNQEPKMRYRDKALGEDGKYYIIEGQRFQNIISFTVLVQANAGQLEGESARYVGADVADRIMDIFEDFMLEYTHVFKRLGASEFVYARRLSDTEINMDQTDVVKRAVTYLLTTEKIAVSPIDRIEKITLDVRQWVSYENSLIEQAATPITTFIKEVDVKIVDLFQGSTPNY